LDLVGHAAVNFHKLLDAQALERRDYRLELPLNKHCIETVLIADRLEDVELYERETVPFAVFELLEELRLRLVVEVRIFEVLFVPQPDGAVQDLGVGLHCAAHALTDFEGHRVFILDRRSCRVCLFLLSPLHC